MKQVIISKHKSQFLSFVGFRFNRICSSILLLLVICAFSFSQGNELRFRYINTYNGLSNDIINCILQDYEGYLWIGTMEGLNRFDGYNNKIFKKELNNEHSLADNMIYDIYLDHLNDIWIGTQNGLCLYNPDYENFTRYKLDSIRMNVNTANRVTGIEENSKNELYVAVELGILYKYIRETQSFEMDTHDFKSIKDLLIDTEDHFWLGGVDGLYYYNQDSNELKQFFTQDKYKKYSPITEVNTLLEEGDTIWAGTIRGRIYYILKSTMEVHQLTYNFEETYYINDIFKGRDGLFYIANTNGLYIYNKTKNSAIAYKRQKDNPDGLNGVGTTQVYQDLQGNIWIGAFQGGANLAVSGKAFNNYNTFSKEITLDVINVNSILEDSRGNLWLGSFDQGVNVIDPLTNKRKLFLNDPKDPSSLAYGSVFVIFEDSHQNIWIGNYLGYLQRYNPATGKFISYPFNPELGSKSRGMDVRSIIEDKEGMLWIVSHSNGLSRFNPSTAEYKHYRSDYNNRNSTLPDDWAFQVISDKTGYFWIATPSGLSGFDPYTEIFNNYYHNEKDTNSLCHNFVTVLFEDSYENLWIGTKYGLDLFDRKANRFFHFFEKDGLPSNQILAILEHKPGELWISTGNGLSRMRYDKEKVLGNNHAEFRNFNKSDNLQDIFFWDRSAIKLKNNNLVFGSEKGIVVFNPDEIEDNKRIPNVYITSFKLFNKDVQIGEYDSILTRNVSKTNEIRLKYNQNFFTLGFVAINYISNENNQYKYFMEGFDKEWINAGNKREATYTNLDPGKYTFMVKASNNDGYWNEKGTSIHLTILPPFWQTWLFRGILVLIIAGISYMGYQYRIHNLKSQNIELESRVNERTEELSMLNSKISKQNVLLEEQKNNVEIAFGELARYRTKLEELVEDRTKELIAAKDRAEESDRLKSSFLTNLSHEIRTPLNSIIGFSNLLCDPELSDDERNSFKTIIEGSNDTLLNLINDIIDFSKIEAGHLDINISDVSLNSVFNNIHNVYGLAIMKQIPDNNIIDFKINASDSTRAVVVSTDEFRLKQVITNLINNAIKFTNEGYIEVGCAPNEDGNMLEFYVKDTGIGIKKEYCEIIFQRFRKVEEDNTNIYRGAGLGLSISQELVKMLGGNIWVESEYKKGSTFHFTIPLISFTAKDISKSNFILKSRIPLLENSVILIAEDDYSNYSYLEKLLQKTKARIIHAENGQQAISLLTNHPEVNLILMDIKMPHMNGIDALKEIRKLHINIPVIAQTAYAFTDEVRKIRESGFSDYIAKPINAPELFALITKHLHI
jgi:signal transduction histidine kinase/ligand-binding sensor domain-containing protein/CheY-like chemotaxis protein